LLDPRRLDFAHLVALQLDQADVAIRTLGQPAKCRAARWSVKSPAPGLDRTDAVGLDTAYRGSDPPGTVSSNPSPSSKQSVSRGISPSCIEKPAVAAGCAGPVRRHGRQRRAGPVTITPTAGNISVGPYSSTAVPALSSVRLRQSQARSAAGASQAADVNAPAACLRSDRAADGRRGWLR
jgi:hypothetical protein